jgi:signal transduction histidine kinase
MNTIVTDLNDLTMIQAGKIRLEYHTVSIIEVVDGVIRSLKKQIDDKNQHLILRIPPDIPLLWADPTRLDQIVTNLGSNVCKYTPDGGNIVAGADCRQETSDLPTGQEFVHIFVKESGIGTPKDEQKKIFQQYFRTGTAQELATGAGLGLANTKSLVQMQGGTIWFTSSGADQGTVFHFTMPIAKTQ